MPQWSEWNQWADRNREKRENSDDSRKMIRFDNVLCERTSGKAAMLRFYPPHTNARFVNYWIPWSATEGKEVQKEGDKGTIYIQKWAADKYHLRYDEDAP